MLAPIFGCEGIDAATKFYVEVLGCEVLASFSLAEDGGDPCYRTLSLKGDHFHLTSFPGDQGTGKAMYVYLDTPEEVDAIYAKVKDYAGIQITVDLQNQS